MRSEVERMEAKFHEVFFCPLFCDCSIEVVYADVRFVVFLFLGGFDY